MAKTGGEIVRASRERAGVKSTSFAFTPDERARLDNLAERYGGKKAAILAGLDALDGWEPSNRELLAMLAKRLPGC